MFLVQLIGEKAQAAGLRFLVIGGHAVNVYSEPRSTLDVDFLVRREDRAEWARILEAEGFKLYHDGGPFLQYSPPHGTSWRLDLMLVNGETFGKMINASRSIEMLGIMVNVPSPDHLIALKLHALRHGPEDRFEKDFGDVVGITRNTGLDPRSSSYREIFTRFGTTEIYEKVLRRLG